MNLVPEPAGTAADLGTGRYTVFAILAADALGVPEIGVRFLDHPDPLVSGLSAKGMGELGIVGAAARSRTPCTTRRASGSVICRSRWTSCWGEVRDALSSWA